MRSHPSSLKPTGRVRGSDSLLLAPRFWVQVGVVSFFGFMMFLLWRREARLDYTVRDLGLSPDYLAATWINYEQAMWIERGGKRIGVYYLYITRDDDTATYQLTLRSRLQLDVFNLRMPLVLDTVVDMSERFELEQVEGRLTVSGETVTVSGFVEDLRLYYHFAGPPMFVAGGSFASVADLEEPVMLSKAIMPLVTQGRRLRVGNVWTTEASNPINGTFTVQVTVKVEAIETIEIDGEEIEAFRLTERTGETEAVSWYDREGNVLKTDLGNGLTMMRADLKEVFELHRDLELPPRFEEMDRKAIRASAAESGEAPTGSVLPWLPNL